MARQKIVPGGEIEVASPAELAELLREYARSGHHAFGSGSIERKRENWPTMGGQREIRVTMARGNYNLTVAAATYTDLVAANDGRGGLNVQNTGSNPCYVFLTTARFAQDQNGVVAAGYLAPSGGAWDGRFGDAEWVGDVSVYSTLGTTLCWGEV